MNGYTFYGDNNPELLTIQKFVVQDQALLWDVVDWTKAIMINNYTLCGNDQALAKKEKLISYTKYSPQLLDGFIGIIAAMFRYEHGSTQLTLFEEKRISEHIKEYYRASNYFKIYFSKGDPKQWRFVPMFKDYFAKKSIELLQFISIVELIRIPFTIRDMHISDLYNLSSAIESEMAKLYNLTINDKKIDFSNMHLYNGDGWRNSITHVFNNSFAGYRYNRTI